jgi:hypothetical protein
MGHEAAKQKICAQRFHLLYTNQPGNRPRAMHQRRASQSSFNKHLLQNVCNHINNEGFKY